ncbi:hypothetical protein IWX90DRAFT_163681 [Phyllosticta citrichinensis]|uniref:Uncharacterized protein n=1 Tax=Phyllosticta citrichinensis TaxID=1130410 RepID=A0ABR1Y138_9PEZI
MHVRVSRPSESLSHVDSLYALPQATPVLEQSLFVTTLLPHPTPTPAPCPFLRSKASPFEPHTSPQPTSPALPSRRRRHRNATQAKKASQTGRSFSRHKGVQIRELTIKPADSFEMRVDCPMTGSAEGDAYRQTNEMDEEYKRRRRHQHARTSPTQTQTMAAVVNRGKALVTTCEEVNRTVGLAPSKAAMERQLWKGHARKDVEVRSESAAAKPRTSILLPD